MSTAPGLLQYFPGTNTPVQYPDLNKLYGNPDLPSSPLYGGGAGGQSTLVFPSVTQPASTDLSSLPTGFPSIPNGLPSIPSLTAGINGVDPLEALAGGSTTNSGGQGITNPSLTQSVNPSLSGLTNAISSIPSSISSGLTGALGNQFAGFSWGRIGAFALALIMIAAGLFLFGSQSSAAKSAVKTIKGVALA
jgi:hypothetical protein